MSVDKEDILDSSAIEAKENEQSVHVITVDPSVAESSPPVEGMDVFIGKAVSIFPNLRNSDLSEILYQCCVAVDMEADYIQAVKDNENLLEFLYRVSSALDKIAHNSNDENDQ